MWSVFRGVFSGEPSHLNVGCCFFLAAFWLAGVMFLCSKVGMLTMYVRYTLAVEELCTVKAGVYWEKGKH